MLISRTSVSLLALGVMLASPSAFAQAQNAVPQSPGEKLDTSGEDVIIVTARKRQETAIEVPVTINALSGEDLAARGLVSLDAISNLAPSVIISDAAGTPQGGIINIRGFSGPENIILVDQSVSFNIDGVQVARSTVRRMSQMDIERVEVLKGPQALFYGKNSPAGVISVRTADPTRDFEAQASLGYEIVGRQIVGQGYVSGPISPDLGARLALYGSKMEGWVKDITPAGTPYTPEDRRGPEEKEFAMRATLKFDNGGPFDARFKFNYGKLNGSGFNSNTQRIDCPGPTGPFGGFPEMCKADDRIVRGTIGPDFKSVNPNFRDGVPYTTQKQILTGLEMNFALSDALTLTSQSGYYDVSVKISDSLSLTPTDPANSFVSYNTFNSEEFSQELRLISDFRGIFDFTIGGYYQSATTNNLQVPVLNAVALIPIANGFLEFDTKALSAFGQVLIRPLRGLEIGLGGRYSYEKKTVKDARTGAALTPISLDPDKLDWNNFSPEVTVTYLPTPDLSIYASYREGFLSGGFNTGSANRNGADASYEQQTITGFEGGVKFSLMDRRLTGSLAIYDYEIKGLLVSRVLENGITVAQNAGRTGLTGVEAEMRYRVTDDLTVHAALAYNDARYLDFTTPCYRGQLQSQGCVFGVPNATGAFALQDLTGSQIPRAPKWSSNLGLSYETDVSADLRVGFTFDAKLSDGYFTDTSNNPAGRLPAFELIDASVRLKDTSDTWELALIGTNLTNQYTWNRSYLATFGGGGTGTIDAGIRTDTYAAISRGRQFLLRATVKFN